MAETFKNQVDALTGFAGTEDDALTDWLQAGTREIINILPPQLKEYCYSKQTFTSAAANSEAETMITGQLGSVYAGSVECRQIRPMDKHKASSSTSLEYASSTDPVYYIEGNKINILPASSSGIYYVVPNPTVAHGSTSIDNFPNEAEYLVVLYASIKALQRLINNITAISNLSISSSAPSAPSLGAVSYSNASNADASSTAVSVVTVATVSKADISGNAPTYTKPTLAGTSTNMLTEIETGTLGSSEEDYEKWFHIAGQYIEDEEDTELAQAQLQKIQTYLQAFSQDIQNELNEFNKENEIYKANIQAELAKHNSDLQKAITQAQIDAQDKQQEAAQTTDVDKFNKSQDQALALQNAAKTMEAIIQNNNNLIAKYQQEISAYSQNVNKEVTQYKTNLEQYGLEFQQYQAQQAKLQQDYDRGIQMLVAPYMPAQPVKGE
tara:strand:- start:2019 stop:3335 length:1317 start_codon:yes stop_codon:yes gene_type:complete